MKESKMPKLLKWLLSDINRIVVAFLVAVFLIAAFYSGKAFAIQLDQQGCMLYAVWARDITWARDVGADKQKVRESLVELQDESPVFTLILRHFDALWNTGMPRTMIAEVVYRECAGRRGKYEDES